MEMKKIHKLLLTIVKGNFCLFPKSVIMNSKNYIVLAMALTVKV